MPRRLLILGLNYAPEPVGIGPYTAGLAESLAARGHAVEVVAAKPYYPQWRAEPDHAGSVWRRSRENGVAITRCAHYVPARPTGMRRLIHLASFAAAALVPTVRAALARPRPEVVLCVAPALLSVPVAWLAARLGGARLWLHVQDFEVEAAGATGLIGGDGSLARLAGAMERALLKAADMVTTISPQMVARLAAKGVAPERRGELRNWADDEVRPASPDQPALRAEWGLGHRQVLLYSGNIANKQGIEILIEAARLLAARDDLVFVICGEGPNRLRLAEMAQGLGNVVLQDLQPRERMGSVLAMASIHLLPQIPGAADLVLPSKLTNMLASGRPVIATAEPGTGLWDEVEGCGICTAPGDARALAEAIAALADAPERRAALGQAAAARAAERWSRASVVDRAEGVLEHLAAGRIPADDAPRLGAAA